jgi:hypothetical protein
MLYEKNDSQTYCQEFKKRFTNFAEKAPILISFSVSPDKVEIIDETTDRIYKFEWDFSIPIKSFIHGIKEVLIKECYPTLEQVIEEEEEVSEDVQIEMASNGIPFDSIPTKRKTSKVISYLIDKVIVFKDIFIIKNLFTGQYFRYKMNKSSVFFLKKIRSNKLDSKQAYIYFMKNSELLNEIIQKEE